MARHTTGQRPFKMLVANLTQGSDPSRGASGNPDKKRTMFTQQHFPQVGRPEGSVGSTRVVDPSTPGLSTRQGLSTNTTPNLHVASTGSFTVADNDFTAEARLYIGPYVLISGDDYTPGGTATLTAVEIRTAVTALPGFVGSGATTQVIITGSAGPDGNDMGFRVEHDAAVVNFTTLSPSDGYLGSAEPTIGAPTLTA